MFLVPGKKRLFQCTRVSSVHRTSNFLQGTRKTRSCLSGLVVPNKLNLSIRPGFYISDCAVLYDIVGHCMQLYNAYWSIAPMVNNFPVHKGGGQCIPLGNIKNKFRKTWPKKN